MNSRMIRDMVATLARLETIESIGHVACAMRRFDTFADVQTTSCTALLKIMSHEDGRGSDVIASMIASGTVACVFAALDKFGSLMQCESIWAVMYAFSDSTDAVDAISMASFVRCLTNVPVSVHAFRFGCPMLRRLANTDARKATLVDLGAVSFIIESLRREDDAVPPNQRDYEGVATLAALSCVATRRIVASHSLIRRVFYIMNDNEKHRDIQHACLEYMYENVREITAEWLPLFNKCMRKFINTIKMAERGCMFLCRYSYYCPKVKLCDCHYRRLLIDVMMRYPNHPSLHAIIWQGMANIIDASCCGRHACKKLISVACKSLSLNCQSVPVLKHTLRTLSGCIYTDTFADAVRNGQLASIFRSALTSDIGRSVIPELCEFIARMASTPHACMILRSFGCFETLRLLAGAYAEAAEVLGNAELECALYLEEPGDAAVIIGHASTERQCSICFLDVTPETGAWCPHCLSGASSSDRQGFHFLCWNLWEPKCPMCRKPVTFIHPHFLQVCDI